MSETPRLTPEETINFALTLAAAGELPAARTGRLILDGLRLAGYAIVPASGATATGAANGGEHQTKTTPKIPQPRTFPLQCRRCNKIRNDQAHLDECDDGSCPF